MAKEKDTSVDRAYRALRARVVAFQIRPGARLNEVALAGEIGASRTPLREALNRLTAEGFLRFEPGRGFFSRDLSIREVVELYQLRGAMEGFAIRQAALAITPDQIATLDAMLDTVAEGPPRSDEELLALDEAFHEALLGLIGNAEMLRQLRNVNARIRFFRWVALDGQRVRAQTEHRHILDVLAAGDPEAAQLALLTHIARRREEIAAAVKECHARLFLSEDFQAPDFAEEGAA